MQPVCEFSLEWSFYWNRWFWNNLICSISARSPNIRFSFAVRASAHQLVTVAVPSLSEHLVAVLARVRSLASMRSNMVQNVAHFNETLAAGETLETLISATSYLVDNDLLLKAFIIGLGNSLLSDQRHRILSSGCFWFVGMLRCYFITLEREFHFFWITFSRLESRW